MRRSFVLVFLSCLGCAREEERAGAAPRRVPAWATPIRATPYDEGTGLPMRVIDTPSKTEFRLIPPGQYVYAGWGRRARIGKAFYVTEEILPPTDYDPREPWKRGHPSRLRPLTRRELIAAATVFPDMQLIERGRHEGIRVNRLARDPWPGEEG